MSCCFSLLAQVFSTFIHDQTWTRVDESLQARVCMRVISTLVSWSNENKSWWEFTSESLYESYLNSRVLVKREQELRESWWELTSESLYESYLNSRVLVKREQELRESWWELTSESLYESCLNSRVLVKREQELRESWQARVCMWIILTLASWSKKKKSCMRVDKLEFFNFNVLVNSCLRNDESCYQLSWKLCSKEVREKTFYVIDSWSISFEGSCKFLMQNSYCRCSRNLDRMRHSRRDPIKNINIRFS